MSCADHRWLEFFHKAQKHERRQEHEEAERLKQIAESLSDLEEEVEEIEKELKDGKKLRATLILVPLDKKNFKKGDLMAGQGDASVAMGSAGVTAVYQKFDSSGAKVPSLGPVVITSDNPAVGEVQADGVTILPKSVGTCNINGVDSDNTAAPPAVLTVTAAQGGGFTATLTLQPL